MLVDHDELAVEQLTVGPGLTAPAALACFYLFGGLLTLVSLVLPGWVGMDHGSAVGIGLAAVASGVLVLALAGILKPEEAFGGFSNEAMLTVAALFVEPVQGAGGVIVPPPGHLAKLRELCRRHDVLFVADEVITGFGRLGGWFASGLWDLDPDLLTLAKGVTSGYLPLGATLVSGEIAEVFERGGYLAHVGVGVILLLALYALGAGARHLVNVSMLAWLGPGFPWATFTVNVVGSLLMGIVVEALMPLGGVSAAAWRTAVCCRRCCRRSSPRS